MRTADWTSNLDAKILLIGETSTLQWSDEIIPYPMFLDYYFMPPSQDLGERSRYSEAANIFDYLDKMTNYKYKPRELYATLMTNHLLDRAPKGKHILIPEDSAKRGIVHIRALIEDNPTIEYVFVMGLQANYHLQKLGCYNCGKELSESFMKGAEPRRTGLNAPKPFYQPVDAKPFREVCFNMYDLNGFKNVKVIPILPGKSFPLQGTDLANYGANFKALRTFFKLQNPRKPQLPPVDL